MSLPFSRHAVASALMAALLPAVGHAAPTELFISEYVEGSSNNKAVEIYNGTGASVDLSTYTLQYFFNGSTSAGNTITLSGALADGATYVVADDSADSAILAVANLADPGSWFNGDDAVVLSHSGTVVDSIGQVGFDPGSEWGTGDVSTANNTIRRQASVCAGDTNSSDAYDPSGEWDGYVSDTFDGLGSHTVSCGAPVDLPPSVSTTTPLDGATGVAASSNVTVNFSETVDAAADAVTIDCPSGSAISASGLPASGVSSVALDPSADLPAGEVCQVTVHASLVTDLDGSSDTMVADYSFSFTVDSGLPTAIHTIQGSGSASPLAGEVHTIEGIVVGVFQGASPQLNGFYVQEEDADADADVTTSEGIFVYRGSGTVSVGDKVSITGTVKEYYDFTELDAASNAISILSHDNPLPTAASISLPLADSSHWEYYEGMRVTFPGKLVVTENYQLGRYGEVVLAGGSPEYQFTHANLPSVAGYNDHLEALARNTVILDDALTSQNPDPIIHGRGGNPLSASNTLRGGDSVTGLTAVLYYSYGDYLLEPLGPVNFQADNPRPAAPEAVGGAVKVASFNVLNYFNTFGTGACTGGVGGAAMDCRGAEDTTEFDRQWQKTVDAIVQMDADVVGLMEMENDGYGADSAIQDLVTKLNSVMGAGTYAFINPDPALGTNILGSDAIKVGLLYKPATVTLLTNGTHSSSDAIFDRPPLVQTFTHTATGDNFTVAVNHFKSKGSCPSAPDANADAGDGQSCWSPKRVQQASALLTLLQGISDDSDILIIGDLNSYAKEDPVTTLIGGGYTDLIGGGSHYSYVFDGQRGYLDHALASAALAAKVAGVTHWHINTDEPSVLDYNTNYKSAGQITSLYESSRYRASDHDPVVVGLNLAAAVASYTLDINLIGDGSGSVSSNPGLDCGLDCSESYTAGSSVDLTATAATGSTFVGWGDDCSGSSNPLTVTLNSDLSCTAEFIADADGDGIPDSVEGSGDSDGDGTPDMADTDSDDDGVPDAEEGSGDSDGDGLADFRDEDDDNDSVTTFIEQQVTGGDGNGDGIQDRLQPHVASLPSATGPYATLVGPSGSRFAAVVALAAPADAGVSFPYGRFSAQVTGMGSGAGLELSVIVPDLAEASGYREHHNVTGNYDDRAANLSRTGGLLRYTVSASDGSDYDQDGSSNGSYATLGGPVTGAVAVPLLGPWGLLATAGLLAGLARRRR